MQTSSDARPYRIVKLLGRGGMAQVFEAVSVGAHGFERRVAVKRILANHDTDPSVLRSFFDEARLASMLHHGGVVAVLDFGVADGAPFQVLELVDGIDARSLGTLAAHADCPIPTILAPTSAARSPTRSTTRTRASTRRAFASASCIAMSSRRTFSSLGRAT